MYVRKGIKMGKLLVTAEGEGDVYIPAGLHTMIHGALYRPVHIPATAWSNCASRGDGRSPITFGTNADLYNSLSFAPV